MLVGMLGMWHSSVVFKNKIWVLGGRDGINSLKNDVWSSPNGISWTRATNNAGWAARYSHSSVVFENKMWVLGGYDGIRPNYRKNDVWSSVDGTNWDSSYGCCRLVYGRFGHSSVVFDNKIWVLGGWGRNLSIYNDVWSSSNGSSWTQVKPNDNAGWDARTLHTSIVFDNKIWVLGGDREGPLKNDVWSSVDGTVWTRSYRWISSLDCSGKIIPLLCLIIKSGC